MRRGMAGLAVSSMLLLVAWYAPSAVASGPGGTTSPDERRFVYAATAESYAGTGLFRLAPTPLGELAPFGNFVVVATGRGVTVEIDDSGTPDGLSVPVRIYAPGTRGFDGCMVVRAPRTFAAVPNTNFSVYIGMLGHLCDTRGSAGVARLTGVR